MLEFERGSTRSHSLESSLLKRLRTCRNADCVVMVSVKTRDVTLAYRGNESVVHMYVSMYGAHMLVHTSIVASKSETSLCSTRN